jgi:predicted RecB family nuclease
MASIPITASMLYDLVACPHRVSMDLFADTAQRDRVSPFVQLLWDRGAAHEKEIVANIGEPFIDLSKYAGDEKERRTLEAMDRGDPLIYGGRISAGELLGDPDLLRKEGTGYVAGDIKSGAGEEGGGDDSDGKPKVRYAVQLGLYTDILERLGRSPARQGFVWDIHGKEVPYDFTATYGAKSARTLWADYEECLNSARAIVDRSNQTIPAYSSGVCKNCVWYTACVKELEKADDLTLIPELGRAKRDAMIGHVASIKAFAASDPATFIVGKKTVFSGIGPATLEKLHARARLIAANDAKPYLREAVVFPVSSRELFFDIEVDPMRDVCYLHGFVERLDGDTAKERFVSFFAEDLTDEAEEQAFAYSWRFMQEARPCAIYYYSKYERTIYRKLRQKYPRICTEDDIESLFDPAQAVDLYFDVVLKATEWPTRDYSIKTLAKYLGFSWRDPHPSGAASIEWFDRWIHTREPSVRQKILDYNEDDCRATRVLLDGVRSLSAERAGTFTMTGTGP